MQPVLRLEAVAKSFGPIRALKSVSLDLRAGEVHALVGENGAGKSTLIKIVAGALKPDAGTIEIGGQVIRHLSPASARARGVACIYQQPALFIDLTVAENIALRLEPAAATARIDWKARRVRARQLLERIGAAIPPDAEVGWLSMPEQQLVEIAGAIGAGARIIVMDEPTASLTQQEQQLLFGVVRELSERGVGIIYISHRLEIFALAHRVTVLRDGESVGTRELGRGRVRTGNRAASAIAGEQDATVVDAATEVPPSLTEAGLIALMVGRELSTLYPPAEGEPGEVVLSLKGVGCVATGVRDVTLEVRAGEIVGLAGLIGAGRTELARVIFGLTPADAGEIHMLGRRVSLQSPGDAIAQGIAYLPEDRRRHGVILEMSLTANISMAIHSRIFPWTWLRLELERRLALGTMNELGIRAPDPDTCTGSLSGGNQQKVAIGRWLATKPRLLILDEPTQGVDVGAKGEIHRILRRLARDGLAVLMISSDLPEVLGMSDRIAVMREGTVAKILTAGSDAHQVMSVALGQAEAPR